MKQTTCKSLRGACDAVILGETPEAMAENSKRHVTEMVQSGDQAHQAAVQAMMQLSHEEQQQWYDDFKSSFTSLPDA